MSTTNARRFWLIFPGALILLCAAPLIKYFTQRPDIWWTPHALAVPLVYGGDRVEVYVRGALLRDLVAAKRLMLTAGEGATVVAPDDIRLRFNNWDRVRVGQVPLLLGSAALAGFFAACLLLAALGQWRPGDPVPRASPPEPR